MNPSEKKPTSIALDSNVFHLDVHPSQNLVVTGMINGRMQCYRYGLEGNEQVWNSKTFKKSCRGVAFSQDGSSIYGISRDKSIRVLDTETANVLTLKEEAHESPINALLMMDDHLMATGDDQGVIKRTLIAVGGDGYLSTWDIRKTDVAAMSDQMEDELLSISLVKHGKKAVVGTQDGVLSLWTWGDWGDYNDRIIGHPNSIDAICKLDEDTVCTGSSDGIIR
ncbi:WD40-repeat-containing domain protein [Choanephora cucurbitarum]|nr:WD40-repeat-containing domain protein [Choanephora cucurbitarum]